MSGRSAERGRQLNALHVVDCAPERRQVVQLGLRQRAGQSAASHPVPGAGSPMPTVIESPSATNVVMPGSPLYGCADPWRPWDGEEPLRRPRASRNCSARARAAVRRDRPAGRARRARRRRDPRPHAGAGSPATSGSADSALTTTGVPQASASSAASPKVSAGPGASTTSALASSAARSAGPDRKPAK